MPKSYEPCYTRTNSAGGKYITCKGTQNPAGRKANRAGKKLKKAAAKAPVRPKAIMAGSGRRASAKPALRTVREGFYPVRKKRKPAKK